MGDETSASTARPPAIAATDPLAIVGIQAPSTAHRPSDPEIGAQATTVATAYTLARPATYPGFDATLATLRSSGLHGTVDLVLTLDTVLKNRLDPTRLDGLTMPDGTVIHVMHNPEDYPDDPEVRRRFDNHYAVFEISNPKLGYVAYMGIHRLTQIASNVEILNGQWRATGGTRIRNYAEGALGALKDALELSQEMSFKAAGAGLEIGGSKCAIHVATINPSPRGPDGEGRTQILASYSQAIEVIGRLIGGGVLTGQDMNISEADALLLFAHAPTSIVPYVAGALSRPPTPATAVGVWAAMSVAMPWAWPGITSEIAGPFFANPALSGKVVAVQGVGGIGGLYLLPLLEAGAIVLASDVNPGAIVALYEQEPRLGEYRDKHQLHIFAEDGLPNGGFSSHIVSPLTAFPGLQESMGIDHIDIFAPFAVGGILDDDSIPRLAAAGVRLVVGSANDMSADKRRHPQMLQAAGILYIPDYIANAGGLLVVDGHLGHEVTDEAIDKRMTDRVANLLNEAHARGLTPQEVADGEARIFFEALPRAPLPVAATLASGDQVVVGGAVLAGEPAIRGSDGSLQPISEPVMADAEPVPDASDLAPEAVATDPSSLVEQGLVAPVTMKPSVLARIRL